MTTQKKQRCLFACIFQAVLAIVLVVVLVIVLGFVVCFLEDSLCFLFTYLGDPARDLPNSNWIHSPICHLKDCFYKIWDCLCTAFVYLVLGYLISWGTYGIFIKKQKRCSKINTECMPLLRPVPIATWKCDHKRSKTGLFTRYFIWLYEPRRWKIEKNWCYKFKRRNGCNIKIVIPKGFIFDGASIPRPFWFFLSPTGLFMIPGLIHDYAYKYGHHLKKNGQLTLDPNGKLIRNDNHPDRSYWDKLFFDMGSGLNSCRLFNRLVWIAVCLGSCFTWCKYRNREDELTKELIKMRKTAGLAKKEEENPPEEA